MMSRTVPHADQPCQVMAYMEHIPTEFDPKRDRAVLRTDTRDSRTIRGINDGVAAWLRYCDEYGLDQTDHARYRRWMEERGTPVGWR